MNNVTLTQDPKTGNFIVEGDLNANRKHTFLNGRFDGLNSAKWINKAMKQMQFAPVKKDAQSQVGVITLDLKNGTLNMKGMDYNRTYRARLIGNQVII